MEDQDIIQLYWDRNDQAISATGEKYGRYCLSIANNILGSAQDAEECVNDAYLRVWNAIPPQRPRRLPAFLGKITRNLALHRYQQSRAEKRGGGELPLVLEELSGCVPADGSPQQDLDRRELAAALNDFVRALPAEKRWFFVRRYWYAEGVGQIAQARGVSPNRVSKSLERTRKQLKAYLTESPVV